MIPDLFLPIIVIVIMFLIIGVVDDGLTLIAIGFLFLPVSYIFAQIINTGGYTTLFGASLPPATVSLWLINRSMFMVPLFAFSKVLYIKHISSKEVKE